MTTSPESHRKILLFMISELEKPLPWLDDQAALLRKYALQWALNQTLEPVAPPGGWQPYLLSKPEDCILMIDRIAGITEDTENAGGWATAKLASLPHPWLTHLAIQWALPILRRAANLADRCDPSPAPVGKIEITTHEWIPALAALAKRELRFWKEAGRVSGNVTRRAASRAIEGLEQIIKTIPEHLRS